MQGIRIVQLKLSRHINKVNFNLHCFIYESYRRGPHHFPQANLETIFLLPLFICYKQFLGRMARKCTLSNHLQNYFVLYFKLNLLNVLSARGKHIPVFCRVAMAPPEWWAPWRLESPEASHLPSTRCLRAAPGSSCQTLQTQILLRKHNPTVYLNM